MRQQPAVFPLAVVPDELRAIIISFTVIIEGACIMGEAFMVRLTGVAGYQRGTIGLCQDHCGLWTVSCPWKHVVGPCRGSISAYIFRSWNIYLFRQPNSKATENVTVFFWSYTFLALAAEERCSNIHEQSLSKTILAEITCKLFTRCTVVQILDLNYTISFNQDWKQLYLRKIYSSC